MAALSAYLNTTQAMGIWEAEAPYLRTVLPVFLPCFLVFN